MAQSIQPGAVYGMEMSGGRVTVTRARRRRGAIAHEILARAIDPATDSTWPKLVERISREQRAGSALLAGVALAQDSFLRPLEVPFSSLAKARAVLPSRLDVDLPVPVERCACAFVHLVRLSGQAGARAIAVAMPGERLETALQACRESGLDPEWMEQEALLLWRTARADTGDQKNDGAVIVLYLASDRVVAVAGREGSPTTVFSARIAWGDDEVARTKLLARLRPFLAGLARDPAMEQPAFLIAGALAREYGDALRIALGIAAGAWRVLPHPETGLVRALAESALRCDEWSGNLREGNAIHPNLDRLRKRQANRASGWVAFGAAALLLAAVTSERMVSNAQQQWQERVQELAREITGYPAVQDGIEVETVERFIQETQEGDKLVDAWLGPGAYPLFSQLLRLVHAREIEVDTLSVGTGQVLLRGRAAHPNEADHIAELLRQEGWVASIESAGLADSGSALFTVRGEVGP